MHTQSHKSPKSIVLEGASPQIQLGVYRIHTYTLILLQATKDSIRAFRGGTSGPIVHAVCDTQSTAAYTHCWQNS